MPLTNHRLPAVNLLKAAIFMLGAVVSFTSMAVAGREAGRQLDTFELMAYRSLIGIVIVLFVGARAGTLGQVNTRQMGLQFLRNVAHFTGQNLWFYAVTVITLPQLFALEFSSPLWVALLAPVFLSERLTRARALAVIGGFIGILIVARPDQLGLSQGIIAAALSAVAFATTTIATKRLTRTQSITSILFWLTVMQAVFGIVLAGYDGDFAIPSAHSLPWVLLIGVAGLFAHYCVTSALSLAPALVVYPMDFLRLPLAAVIGILFYAEPLQISVFVGGAIILTANLGNVLAERRHARAP